MRTRLTRPKTPRRGLTLIEMLVVVALVVLMMLILVSIFAAATGAITVSRTLQGLDQELRQLDGILRRDLNGLTAHLTPPMNPTENRGYFEYSENAFADIQGDDTDDTLRMTVQAPQGQPFVGRLTFNVALPNGSIVYRTVPVTSEYAEVIYFLRNGNLYRRTLLVMPERKGSLQLPVTGQAVGGAPAIVYPTGSTILSGYTSAGNVSWQGLNDISARPQFFTFTGGLAPPIPNSLGDLSNRENRAFSARFCDDFVINSTAAAGPDGIPDDGDLATAGVTGFGIPDYWPTLYPAALSATVASTGFPLIREVDDATGTTVSRPTTPVRSVSFDTLAFPYLFPSMYSKPSPINSVGVGALHVLDPTFPGGAGSTFNHAPLSTGDSLLTPPINTKTQLSTWWGFPLWRETISPSWNDPVWQINNLSYSGGVQAQGISLMKNFTPLPPQNISPYIETLSSPDYALFSDGAGDTTGTFLPSPKTWEDELLMTGVRSFDVKAFEQNAIVYDANLSPNPQSPGNHVLGAGYFDLGYLEQWSGNGFVAGFPTIGAFTQQQVAAFFLQGLGHEGRIPPLFNDFRADAQWPLLSPNIGDDDKNGVGVVRLRRVYDTWSTTYTNAPSAPVDAPLAGPPYLPPVYPSYPPPYTAPLRGIQIQIRVVDPKNEKLRVLTIRQDFTDKQS